jgi:hypothetical protein
MKASELGALTQPRLPAWSQPGSPALSQPGSPALSQPGSPALSPSGSPVLAQPGLQTLGQPGWPANGQPVSLEAPEYPFAKTLRPQGLQMKTLVLMVVAIVAGLIASSMTFRLMDNTRKESLYRNQPTSYWSQKLQEPIQRKEVWQGHLKMMKDIDPAADLRRGDPEAVPVLIELLQDQNSIVRQEAILILARVGGPARSAVPALQQALNDPDEQVRARATTALKQIEMAVEAETNSR